MGLIELGSLSVEARVARPARPELEVLAVGTGEPPGLDGEVEIDATPLVAAFARGPRREQLAGLVVYYAGARVRGIVAGSWEISAAMGAPATWRLEVAMPSPFGAPRQFLGAPPGRARIDLYGWYLPPTGAHLIPMILNGRVHDETRGTKIASLSGTDGLGRLDNTVADVSLPAGHGLSTGQIIEQWAAAAGVQTRAIPAGSQRFKAARVDGPWLPDARARAELEGWELQVSRDGILEAVPWGYDPSRRVDAYLTAHDLVDVGGNGPITFTSSSDLVTRATITGTAPVTRNACGRKTLPPVSVETYGEYTPVVMAYVQNAGGSLTATGATSDAAWVLRSRTVSIREEECGSPVSDTEYVYGWYNPQAARGDFNGDGTINARGGVYLLAGAVAGDESLAYAWPGERFVLIGLSQTRYIYESRTYQGELREYLVRSERRTWSPRFTAAAVKERATPADPWEGELFDTARHALGNRFGVAELSEIMPNPQSGVPPLPTDVEVIEYTVTDLGYITSQTRTLSTWWSPAGSLFLYGGDITHAFEEEVFRPFEVEKTDYVAETGNRSHQSTRTLQQGDEGPAVTIERGLDGYLPEAQQRVTALDGGNFPAGQIAVPGEAAGWTAEVIRRDLEAHHDVQSGGTSQDALIESAAEGQRVLERRLRDGAAAHASTTLPLNWLVGRGAKLNLRLPVAVDLLGLGPGQPFDFYVDRETHASSGSPAQMTTRLDGRVYIAERSP